MSFLAISSAGATRLVILIGEFAIKLPKPTALARFWRGCRGNSIEEREHFPELCPVLWCIPFGLALVMPRARMMTDPEFWAWAESAEYPATPRSVFSEGSAAAEPRRTELTLGPMDAQNGRYGLAPSVRFDQLPRQKQRTRPYSGRPAFRRPSMYRSRSALSR